VRFKFKEKNGQVYLKVLEAKHVGKDGSNLDVYCQVFLDKEKVYKTEVLKKTGVDPKWEHEVGKIFHIEKQEEVKIVVKDANMILPDTFLGQVVFNLNDLHDGVPRDNWYNLETRPGKKDKVHGQLHLHVMFSPTTDGGVQIDDFIYPIQTLIKKKNYQF